MNNHRWRLMGWLGLCLLAGSAHAQPVLTEPHAHAAQPAIEETAHAAHDAPRFERFWLDDGLSVSQVTAITQDHEGFLWVGTEHGLNRFDGYEFHVYTHDPEDPASLSNDYITALHEDPSGTLWIGTLYGGLCQYDRSQDAFRCHRPAPPGPDPRGKLPPGQIYTLATGPAGRLWLGVSSNLDGFREGLAERGALCRLDAAAETFACFHPRDADGARLHRAAFALWPADDGHLWVGMPDGLYRFRPDAGTFTPPDPAWPEALRTAPVRVLYEAPSLPGVLWAGTADAGLFRIDVATSAVVRYRHRPTDPTSLGAGTVTALQEGHDHGLWISTDRGGLSRLDLHHREAATATFTRVTHDPLDPTSISHNGVFALHEDHTGILWVGTLKGINKHNPVADQFTVYHHVPADPYSLPANEVVAVHAAEDGGIWVSTSAPGLVRIDPATGRALRQSGFAGTLAPMQTQAVVPALPHVLWMGGSAPGLFRINTRTGAGSRRLLDPEADEATNRILTLAPGTDSTLWIGTLSASFFNLDPATDRLRRYTLPRNTDTIASLHADRVRPGVLWIGTIQSGMLRFEQATNTFTRFGHTPDDPASLSGNEILSIVSAPNDPAVLWIAAYRSGLNRFDTRSGQITRFTRFNSNLPGNGVGVIRFGEDGMLWIASNHGLIRFDPETHAVKVYDSDDGLRSREFIYPGLTQGPDGKLYLSTLDGLHVFRPEDLTDDPHPPHVVLTDFRLDGESVGFGLGAPLAVHISETEAVSLPHDQNDVAFDFVALHFGHPERNRYRYRLAGYDDDWRTGAARTATFTNLPPGSYRLEVRAANADGVWSEEPRALRLTIRPPWWRTWWAYLGYALLFGMGLFGVDRYQRRRLIAQEREKTQARELAQAREIERAYTELKTTQAQLVHAEKMASLGALTAGIAHEIKNPLNFINNFADLNAELADELREMMDDGADADEIVEVLEDLKGNAESIARHGHRADSIVRNMMAHARTGSGQRVATDLNTLVAEHLDLAYHGKRAQVPDFNTSITKDLGEAVGEVSLVPQDLGRVVLNLVGNAFDALREAGTPSPVVTVTTRRVGDAVEIRVADNGPGIPEDVRARIFEPFFTTKPAGSGTGLGLSLSYDIVTQGHGGTLTVESAPGQGAVFIVNLPA